MQFKSRLLTLEVLFSLIRSWESPRFPQFDQLISRLTVSQELLIPRALVTTSAALPRAVWEQRGAGPRAEQAGRHESVGREPQAGGRSAGLSVHRRVCRVPGIAGRGVPAGLLAAAGLLI